jgi:hypothetical protein
VGKAARARCVHAAWQPSAGCSHVLGRPAHKQIGCLQSTDTNPYGYFFGFVLGMNSVSYVE